MRVIAAMFDTRARAEDAIERLVAARCPRDAVTFLPEEELSEIATSGNYDWRGDRWGLWRGLIAIEALSNVARYSLAEGMNRGGSVLLVAARNDDDVQRFGSVLSEAGAIDLDELEQAWRDNGWTGFDGPPETSSRLRDRLSLSSKVRVY